MIAKALKLATVYAQQKKEAVAATRLQYFWRYVQARAHPVRQAAMALYEKYIDPKTQVCNRLCNWYLFIL